MELKISTNGYNNIILIATPDLKFGINSTINLMQADDEIDDPPIEMK